MSARLAMEPGKKAASALPLRSLASVHRGLTPGEATGIRTAREDLHSQVTPQSSFGSDFSHIPSHSVSSVAGGSAPHLSTQSCPLAANNYRACPSGVAYHTCPARIQMKLAINKPGDEYEQEADRVAEQVMRIQDGRVVQRKCLKCHEDDEELLRTEEVTGPVLGTSISPEVTPIVQKALESPGQPLDQETRALMEPRFGHNFKKVRVHTDKQATESTRAVNALAYTVGWDVVFGAEQYRPRLTAGQRLLAHELTHVVQGTDPSQRPAKVMNTASTKPFIARKPDQPKTEDQPTARKPRDLTWLEILPCAGGKKTDQRIASVENLRGQAPTLKYSTATNINVIPGAPEGQEEEIETITDPEVLKGLKGESKEHGHTVSWEALSVEIPGETLHKRTIDAIIAARASIPLRDIGRNPWEQIGNFYDPQLAAKRGDQQAVDYNQWMASATPSVRFDPKDGNDLKKWQIFQRTINLEGRVGTITTADRTLTIGVGFSSAGTQAGQVIRKIFEALPEVKKLAFNAGLALDENKLLAVDTNKGWIVQGDDAAAYVQTDIALLSLLINVSQGTQSYSSEQALSDAERDKQRQTMLNAQWTTFLDNALQGIQASMLGWPDNSLILAVHSRHALQATFPWSFWESHSTNKDNLRELVRDLYNQLQATNQRGWLFHICGGIYKPHAEAIKVEEEGKAKP